MDFLPGEKLRVYRQHKGLTQGGLALLLNSYQMYISRVERNEETPPDYMKEMIEDILGTDIWPKENSALDKDLRNKERKSEIHGSCGAIN